MLFSFHTDNPPKSMQFNEIMRKTLRRGARSRQKAGREASITHPGAISALRQASVRISGNHADFFRALE